MGGRAPRERVTTCMYHVQPIENATYHGRGGDLHVACHCRKMMAESQFVKPSLAGRSFPFLDTLCRRKHVSSWDMYH